MVETHGLSRSTLQPALCLVREAEPTLLVVPFLRSSLHSFQSASFLGCQVLSRQGLDRGLSQDSAVLSWKAQCVRQGWRLCQSPAQICRKLLISVSNCWRRGNWLLVGWGWGVVSTLPSFLHLSSSSPAIVNTCLSSGSPWHPIREAGRLMYGHSAGDLGIKAKGSS